MALADTFVKRIKHTGRPAGEKHTDGAGMYLLVKASGKYWRMDYAYLEKRKTMALGIYPAVSLAQARQRREQVRAQLAEGVDPMQAKREHVQVDIRAATHSFKAVAYDWLVKTSAARSPATQAKITAWLEKDLIPFLGAMPVSLIGPRDVLAALRKMEARGALESVHRVKQVCGQVFRYAVATGSAERDVTQDLKGALAKPKAGHFAAITEPRQTGELLRAIHSYAGHACTVIALKLSPLLFVRPGELRTAEWIEMDLDAAQWRIPGVKMKMRTDHLVPLSTQAITLLREMQAISGHGRYVFPSIRTSERPMSENTINAALRALGYNTSMHTAHGFRAMARTIMDEVLNERVDLIEHQLAHAVKDPNGRAYNRTAHMPARQAMMQRWADYLDKLRVGADVLQFKAA